MNPDEIMERFGADAVRLYMFAGPLDEDDVVKVNCRCLPFGENMATIGKLKTRMKSRKRRHYCTRQFK